MEGLITALTVITGLLLRFGLPIAITALAVWGLKKLDARWQAEARQSPIVLQTTRNTGCWEVNGCSDASKALCGAYAHPEVPCWQYFRNGNQQLQERCLDCDVFKQAPVPVPVQA